MNPLQYAAGIRGPRVPFTRIIDLGFVRSSCTFTRATSATYFDANGVLQTAASGVLRNNAFLSGVSQGGLLLEPAATNEALHCRDFTNAAWSKTNVTAAKDAVGIDGAANSASTLTASANNGTALQSITAASVPVVTSFFVKRKTGTGTIEITDNGGTNWTDITSSINSSTFTRVTIRRTLANPSIGFRLGTSGDEIIVDFAQCERVTSGTTGLYATSPIATTTAAVTRNADNLEITSLNTRPWWNTTQGTFYAEVYNDEDLTVTLGSRNIVGADLGSASFNERIILSKSFSLNQIQAVWRTGGTDVASLAVDWGTQTVTKKIASAWKADSFQACVAGTLGTEDTSGAVPASTHLRIGAPSNTSQFAERRHFGGLIYRLLHFPVKLPNAQLQAITA